MRPDRIVVGEVRGAETLDMLQAMNTGHEGSLTTIHANSPRDALARLEVLVLMAGLDLPLRAIREQISSAFDVVIQLTRLADGSRRVTHVTEVLRMESDVVTVQDLFVAKAELRPDGTVSARPRPTGIRPHFGEKLAAAGVALPPEVFDPAERNPAAASTGRRRS
jgi:pilus assembly protein CpaF